MVKHKGNLYKHKLTENEVNEIGWTRVPNNLLDHSKCNLTSDELRVLLILLSRPEDWFQNDIELWRTSGLSKGMCTRAKKGLANKKFLVMDKLPVKGRYTYTYDVFEQPYPGPQKSSIEKQDLENKALKTSTVNQDLENEEYINTNNKDLITNTEEKEGKEKYIKDSDISISSTLDKLKAKGVVCDNLQEICSKLKPLDRSNHLAVLNSICNAENDVSKLKQALCDYVNSFAEKGDVITPTRFCRLKKKLDEVCTDTAEKIQAVENATEGGWTRFFPVKEKSVQKAAPVRSYGKPEKPTKKDTGSQDHTRKEREEENG